MSCLFYVLMRYDGFRFSCGTGRIAGTRQERVLTMAKVTDVRIRKGYEEGDQKIRAVVSVTLDDMYVIHGIKILKGETGYFIGMPSKKVKEGEFKDIFHPVNSEARQILQDEILEIYLREEAVSGGMRPDRTTL